MQNNHKSRPSKPSHSNHKDRNNSSKPFNNQGKSLLQRIITTNHTSVDKQNHQSGKILITKLNDFVQNRCIFGGRCAHLRVQGACSFLHQKRDFQGLCIPLPEKYLQNQQPLKKSKQQRKQDKIRERAERAQRLQQKLEAGDRRQERQEREERERMQERQQKRQDEEREEVPVKKVKVVAQKVMDQRQLLIQKIVKPQQGQLLQLGHIYHHMNLITSAISKQQSNIYSEQFNLKQLNMSLQQVRKRLLMKLKKNKEFQSIFRLFVQKQGGFVKKLIKNITGAYEEMVESVKEGEKWRNVDLRQIQQTFTVEEINRVLNSKKENTEIIQYYSRLFSEDYGWPISFELNQEESTKLNQGGLLPLRKFMCLPIISPNFTFSRIFLSLDLSFSELKALSQFSSLLIPQQIATKVPVQKTYCIDMSTVTYSKFVEQIMTEHLADYHDKIKGPAKEFEFGKMEENLKKYRAFLAKYKAKITALNKENNFILVVYNIKSFTQKIETLNIQQNLEYDQIKKDRSLEEQSTYQRLFLVKEFINIIGEGDSSLLKVIYVTPNKKFKPKNHRLVLQGIDKGLVELVEGEKMQEEVK